VSWFSYRDYQRKDAANAAVAQPAAVDLMQDAPPPASDNPDRPARLN
jgi:hypothetical protein